MSRLIEDYLRYDPVTGYLYWIKSPNNGVPAGSRAGNPGRRQEVNIGFNGRNYLGHRVGWRLHYGEWPRHNIDHKDRDPSNNKIENLRLCSQSQNIANSGIGKGNSSGIKGVYYAGRIDKYVARIKFRRQNIHIGVYKTKEEAAAAYEQKAKELFSEFARSA